MGTLGQLVALELGCRAVFCFRGCWGMSENVFRIKSDFATPDNPFARPDNPNPVHVVTTISCSESEASHQVPNPNPTDSLKPNADTVKTDSASDSNRKLSYPFTPL